jgi:hypothetical protein
VQWEKFTTFKRIRFICGILVYSIPIVGSAGLMVEHYALDYYAIFSHLSSTFRCHFTNNVVSISFGIRAFVF